MLEQERLTIRLPDGSSVNWTPEQIAAYQDDWTVILVHANEEHTNEPGARRLLACLAHSGDVTCEVCGGDE
jgi:hypothetical protein